MKEGDKVYCKKNCEDSSCWFTQGCWYEIVSREWFINDDDLVCIIWMMRV